ncbi:integrase [Burkholderia sp. Nafp2/4-1b]|nr:integrase [Burkholderia sp. Nafp2/4-1b]
MYLLPKDDAPTFHQIRSLAKRLYDAQGNVDTKALLGHTTDEMSEMYANSRGLAPMKVTVAPLSSEQSLNKF